MPQEFPLTFDFNDWGALALAAQSEAESLERMERERIGLSPDEPMQWASGSRMSQHEKMIRIRDQIRAAQRASNEEALQKRVPMAERQEIAEGLVGLEIEEAKQLAASHGLALRVTHRDGAGMMKTADSRGDRINVAVEGETVTEFCGIG